MKIILILILFFGLIIITTYPLIFKINTYLPGFFSTDESYAVLWNAWFIKFATLSHLSIQRTDFIAYPSGMDFYTNKPVMFLVFIINYCLSLFTNPVLTYNLQIILNMLLAALFNYLLVYLLTKNNLCAIFSGITFGFCPYIFIRSWQHLGETYIWIMPFVLFSLLLIREKPYKRIKALFVLGLILTTIGLNFYYLAVTLGVFLIYFLNFHLKNKTLFGNNQERIYLKNILFLSLLAFIILLPQIYAMTRGIFDAKYSAVSPHNPYRRPFEDLFSQSARPLSYFLPAVAHPIFGKFTEQFIGSQLYGMSFTEHTLYLGWTPLILAFVAFKRWKKLRRGNAAKNSAHHWQRDNFYIGFFIFLAVVAWLFSQPPWWKVGVVKIFMPSFFMYKVLPMFRAYCRFGVVVMLAVAVLSGFGLKSILKIFKTQKTKVAITTLFCGLVLFEFWNYPPFKVIDVSSVPQVYYWLKAQQGDFVVAEYPLDIIGPNELYKLYQTKHQKKLINGATPGTYAHRIAQTITKLSEPHTASVLKWMGVRYVLLHREAYLKTGLLENEEELDRIPSNPGLKFIKNFSAQRCPQEGIMCIQKSGPIDIYEVAALPIQPKVEEE